MKNIVVATDLSERSDRAMDRAALIAKQKNALLHIIHVVDDEVTSSVALDGKDNATAELRRQVKQCALFKSVRTKIHVEFGHPWSMIIKLAEDRKADLVILGTHRNRGIRELFSGTTVDRIAKACTAPVLVVAERATDTYSRIIVGVDFSKCAQHATDVASSLANRQRLTLVHAFRIPFKALTMRADEHGDIIMRERKRIKTDIRRRMKVFIATLKTRPDTKMVIKEGASITVLQAEVASGKADLVCVGSHGKPWLVEAVSGSTAHELLSSPPCDVLVAPLR